MNILRTSYITAFLICLPIFIWICGTLVNKDITLTAKILIEQAVPILFCLQFTAIMTFLPFHQARHTLSDNVQAALLLILTPLPLLSIACLAAAISSFAIIKMIIVLILVAIFIMALSELFIYTQCQVKVDIFFGIIASISIWSTRVQWQTWLI